MAISVVAHPPPVQHLVLVDDVLQRREAAHVKGAIGVGRAVVEGEGWAAVVQARSPSIPCLSRRPAVPVRVGRHWRACRIRLQQVGVFVGGTSLGGVALLLAHGVLLWPRDYHLLPLEISRDWRLPLPRCHWRRVQGFGTHPFCRAPNLPAGLSCLAIPLMPSPTRPGDEELLRLERQWSSEVNRCCSRLFNVLVRPRRPGERSTSRRKERRASALPQPVLLVTSTRPSSNTTAPHAPSRGTAGFNGQKGNSREC